jgi:hypothetical protein
MSTNVGQCWQCHICVEHGRKCWGSRWNRFASSYRSTVISTSGFRGLHFEFRMSANVVQCVGSVISELSMVENVGMAVEIVFVVVIFQSVFGFPAAKLDFW